MKRIFAIFCLLTMLCGCASASAGAEAAPAAETTAAAELWTEERLLEICRENAREGAEVMDCVIVEESQCGIVGAVQYTLEDPQLCRFDFIKADGSICRMGMEFITDGEKTLTCASADQISCKLFREDGSAYIATILYYEDQETQEKGFKVSEENTEGSLNDQMDPAWTEQELLTAFHQYAEMEIEVAGCVVFPESNYGIAGVVSYTDAECCWFDFLDETGFPRSTGIPKEIEDSLVTDVQELKCIGKDTVSCRLLTEDGLEYTCTIHYYETPGNKESGFQINME